MSVMKNNAAPPNHATFAASARRRGVASALVRDLMGRAADFGIRDLYLYTNGAEGLYQKLDWRVLLREPYMGREVTIMTSRLSNGPVDR